MTIIKIIVIAFVCSNSCLNIWLSFLPIRPSAPIPFTFDLITIIDLGTGLILYCHWLSWDNWSEPRPPPTARIFTRGPGWPRKSGAIAIKHKGHLGNQRVRNFALNWTISTTSPNSFYYDCFKTTFWVYNSSRTTIYWAFSGSNPLSGCDWASWPFCPVA